MDQSSPHKKTGFFWPLVLIGLGVIFLLDNLNIISGTVWDIVARYWPVLLILMALENLLRGEGFFGPIFMIGAAAIFQLSLLDIIHWDIWEIILRFWPVIIIVIGMDILTGHQRKRSPLVMIAGLLVLAAIIAGIAWYTSNGPGSIQSKTAQTILVDAPTDKAQRAKVTITAPLAVLNIGPGAGQGKLAEGSINLPNSDEVSQDLIVSGDTGELTLESSTITTFSPGLNRAGANWTIKLTDALPIDMTVTQVFSKGDINLSKANLDGLKLDNVFSTMDLNLPGFDDYSGSIDAVFSTLTLHIPVGAAVTITSNGFLTTSSIPDDYSKSGNIIQSPEAAAGKPGINMALDGFFSTIKIVEGKLQEP